MTSTTGRASLARPRPYASPDVAMLGGTVRYVGKAQSAVTELTADDFASHRRRYGPRPHTLANAGSDLIAALDAVNLTGRGGGHFPVAAKWRAVRAAGSRSVVVANGAEGEPLSGKDAALLELRPHLVLDGLACAAEALGADDCVVWLHEGADATLRTVSRALLERRAAGLIEPAVRIEVGPDRYISGESSAIVRALSGGPALPLYRRPPTAVSGVDGRPTLVQNVETLARVGLAARDCDLAARSTLITVATTGQRIVLEVDESTPVRQAVAAAIGATIPQAVLVGGYGGIWAPWSAVADVPLTERHLRAHGVSLGAGILLPLAADSCGILRTAEIADFMANSSARQCGSCVFGLRAVADLLLDLADGQSKRRDPARLKRFLAEIDGRGGCHHPDGVVKMVASATTTFNADVKAHLSGRCVLRRSRSRRG